LQYGNLSVHAYNNQDYSSAITYARHAIDLMQHRRRPDSRLCFPLRLIGLSLLSLRQPEDAIPPLERALELHAASVMDIGELPKTQLALARALWDAHRDRRRAVELATAAAKDLETNDSGGIELAETQVWLAAHSAHSIQPDSRRPTTR
jgi:hypothetical protein